MEPKTCTICGTDLIGAYCHNCGQHDTGKRVRWSEMISDFISGIFSLERSVLGTMYHLVTKPQKVIENYWAGYRNYYHSPGKLAFYALFIIGLHFAFIGGKILGLTVRATDNVSPQVILLLFFIPLISLASYVTFLKRRRNFLEHFVATTYLFSCWIIILVILDDLVSWILPTFLDNSALFIFAIILFLWSARIFTIKQYWALIVLNTILEFILFVIIIVILMGILYLVNPESINIRATTD